MFIGRNIPDKARIKVAAVPGMVPTGSEDFCELVGSNGSSSSFIVTLMRKAPALSKKKKKKA